MNFTSARRHGVRKKYNVRKRGGGEYSFLTIIYTPESESVVRNWIPNPAFYDPPDPGTFFQDIGSDCIKLVLWSRSHNAMRLQT
jgi:hypothetical protein